MSSHTNSLGNLLKTVMALSAVATAILAFNGPAMAEASEEASWHIDGIELVGEAPASFGSGTLQFSFAGSPSLSCSVEGGSLTISNDKENEGPPAQGSVDSASMGSCTISAPACTVSKVEMTGLAGAGYWQAGFSEPNIFETEAHFAGQFEGSYAGACGGLEGKKTWGGTLAGEWDDSDGCVTFDAQSSDLTYGSGWEVAPYGEFCFSGSEGKELRIDGPTPPIFVTSVGQGGSGNGQFVHPYDVAIDSVGNLWVADTENHRVVKFNSKGEYLSKFGSYGSSNGQFQYPLSIAVDTSDNLWVSDFANNRIQKFNSKGEYLSKFGSFGSGNGQFAYTEGDLTFDATGNLWVADTNNNRIQKFNSKGEYLSKFGSYGSGNGQLDQPLGIDVDAAGNIWVADSGNFRIQKFNSSGTYLSKFGSYGSGNGQFADPTGLAIDNSGWIWVSDSADSRVQIFNSSGTYLSKFGSQGSGSGQFSSPVGLAFDAAGDAWIADAGNNRIQKWAP